MLSGLLHRRIKVCLRHRLQRETALPRSAPAAAGSAALPLAPASLQLRACSCAGGWSLRLDIDPRGTSAVTRISICVHEVALGCTPKTPLFLAVRLLNRQFFSRASARFHPPPDPLQNPFRVPPPTPDSGSSLLLITLSQAFSWPSVLFLTRIRLSSFSTIIGTRVLRVTGPAYRKAVYRIYIKGRSLAPARVSIGRPPNLFH